jgi:putative membrane-bound dehydrogenase-like protein
MVARRRLPTIAVVVGIVVAVLTQHAAAADGSARASSHAVNTQRPGEEPPAAADLVRGIDVPDGFRVTLFAAEPDVSQPIAMTTDARGRLWVVENYSYPEWRQAGTDRVLVFEDADGDGRFDTRKIFLEGGRNLTGIELGYGGVWLTSPPELLFVPDRDRDDRPDGPAEPVLDGFNAKEVGHNVVNGLKWGPDGWLYGRHGIQATSRVGRPGTPDAERTPVDCGIFRLHPRTRRFEVVARGTTNPWGLDYDDFGEMIFTNNVIGHLWHLIPGAHYERMYGVDPEPHVYEFLPQCADHLHWLGGEWQKSRETDGRQDPAVDALGGGHSHCGGMIYLGDMFPAAYRGTIFMCNTHGKRVNVDRLEYGPRGIVGRHDPDFLKAFDTWFRGIELLTGPDGRVWIADWTDKGECHDHDGVHRTSGRIYTVLHGEPPQGAGRIAIDLHDAGDEELVAMQLHQNDWFCRQSRQELADRQAAGRDLGQAARALRTLAETHADPTRRVRGLWAAHAVGAADAEWLRGRLADRHESVRAWAMRLLLDDPSGGVATSGKPEWLGGVLVDLARNEPSGLVRLHLAGGMGRLPHAWRWEIATAMASRPDDADWNAIALLLWYGLRDPVAEDPVRAAQLAATTGMPSLRRLIMRRLAFDCDRNTATAAAVEALLASQLEAPQAGRAADILQGMAEALRGRRRVVLPTGLRTVVDTLIAAIGREAGAGGDAARAQQAAATLAALVAKERTTAELKAVATDGTAPVEARREAIAALGESGGESGGESPADVLSKLLDDRSVRGEAARALAGCATPEVTKRVVDRLGRFSAADRSAALDWVVRRADGATAVLDAIESQKLPASDLSATQARALHDGGDAEVAERLVRLWGAVRETPLERREAIESWRKKLEPSVLAAADRSAGRGVWQARCGTCHMLFGEGGRVGPDLTGSGRAELDYVLVNVLDPSAVVPEAWRLTQVITDDGRVLSGALAAADDRTVTLRTPEGEITIDRDDVEEIQKRAESVMPEGLLNGLSDEQVRDLVAYLASPRQVPAGDPNR